MILLSMGENPITRAYLESLTASELLKVADNMGVDIPPDLDRIFIMEEILEICSIDEEPAESQETLMVDTVLIESAPLPKHYNITFIEVMVRDPLWAFVFWEIKSQDKEQFEKSPDFDGYYLKVSPVVLPVDRMEDPYLTEAKVFKIPVKPDDTAWYLGLNPSMSEKNEYKVEFCVEMKGEETVVAVSNPVKLPELPREAGKQKPNPLIHLSGYEDFHILRNKERSHRTKKAAASNEQ